MNTTQLNQLYQWLNSQNHAFLQEQLADVLAVINLMQRIEYQTSREAFTQQLLAQNSTVNYGQSDFVVALLASDYIGYSNHTAHQAACHQYRLLLAEIINDTAPLNNHQIQAFKAGVQKKYGASTTVPSAAATTPKQDIGAFVERTLHVVETASSFGQNKPINQAWLNSQCDAIMVWACRRYDLPLALRSLRAKQYLDRNETLAVKTTQEFIALQQCADGSFGDYASCLQALTQQHQAQQAQIEFNIKIKLATQVLWTTYEVDHRQNLFSLLAANHNELFNPTLPQVASC